MKKLILYAALAIVAFSSCNTDTVYETVVEKDEALYNINRAALLRMNTGEEITVVGHKSQDPDAVCSAISMAALMQQLGMSAKACIQEKPTRAVKYIFDYTGFPVPEVRTSIDADKPLMLTDHNDYLQSLDGADKANVVGIVDHHGISSSFTCPAPIFCKFMNVGSTNTIVYSLYKECGIVPTKDIARILAIGILADTDSLSKAMATPADSVAVSQLYEIAQFDDISELWQGIKSSIDSYDGMTDEEIYLSDTKLYDICGIKIAVASLDASESMPIEELCKRMRGVMPSMPEKIGAQMVFAKIERKTIVETAGAEPVTSYITHIPYAGEQAKEAAELAFGPTTHDNCIVVDRKVNRKSDFIPKITAVLEANVTTAKIYNFKNN